VKRWWALVLTLPLAGCAPVAQQGAPRPAPPAPPPTAPAPGAPAPPPAVEPPMRLDGEPVIDIGLAWNLDTSRVSFEGTQELEVVSEQRPGLYATAGPVELRISGSQLLVTPRDKRRAVPLLVLHEGDTLWVGSRDLERGAEAAILWRREHWRGRFKLFLNAERKITVATRLQLESYLQGVVPGEIGALADSLLEAGRAQAIAARSYTLFYKGRRGAMGFDLFSTVEDQVYGALEGERPLATRCVQTTRGLVGVSQGRPVRANYYSTCGGITAEAWEAWPTEPYAYLTSHLDAGPGRDHCAASPHHRWREEWTAREFATNVSKNAGTYGVPLPPGGVGEIRDVRVQSRSLSGRVWWLEVETSTGLIRIHAHSLRQMLRRAGNPSAILRSNLFKIDVRRDPSTRRVTAVVASGAGSGHGVGLCQTGALGMARQGSRGEAILAHYYPGATLERLY